MKLQVVFVFFSFCPFGAADFIAKRFQWLCSRAFEGHTVQSDRAIDSTSTIMMFILDHP